MDNFTLQSRYLHLVALILCFALFKISNPSIHSNLFKMLAMEINYAG